MNVTIDTRARCLSHRRQSINDDPVYTSLLWTRPFHRDTIFFYISRAVTPGFASKPKAPDSPFLPIKLP